MFVFARFFGTNQIFETSQLRDVLRMERRERKRGNPSLPSRRGGEGQVIEEMLCSERVHANV
jgi:hypothetical protein